MNISDTLQKDFSKGLLDEVGIYDIISKKTNITKSEIFSLLDNFERNIVAFRQFIESLTINDVIFKEADVLLDEAFELLDNIEKLTRRNIFEIFYLIDEFLRQASIHRVFNERININDIIQCFVEVFFIAEISFVDELIQLIEKRLEDSIILNDEYERVIQFIRVFPETINCIDNIRKLFDTRKIEEIEIIDNLTKIIFSIKEEVIEYNDIFSRQVAFKRNLQEFLVLSDGVKRFLGTVKKETLTIDDVIVTWLIIFVEIAKLLAYSTIEEKIKANDKIERYSKAYEIIEKILVSLYSVDDEILSRLLLIRQFRADDTLSGIIQNQEIFDEVIEAKSKENEILRFKKEVEKEIALWKERTAELQAENERENNLKS